MNTEYPLKLGEVALLALWVTSPAIILAFISQLIFFKRQRIRVPVAALAIILTAVGIPILSFPLWAVLPHFLLPRDAIPAGTVIPPFFFPGYFAAALLATGTAWTAKRMKGYTA